MKWKIPKPPRYRGRIPKHLVKCKDCGWRVPRTRVCLVCGKRLDAPE